ncbi:MAG: hypothetical protein HZA92_19510 [Verrucomicrobia bacterium]|nr:hypothetical protein [Verrucomicrobiota bacterium]
MMKNNLVKILVGLAAVALIAMIAVFLSLNSIVKNGVTAFGPEVIKAPIQLDGVSISAFSGRGEIKGLVVGNPEGFKTPNAVKLGTASLQVKPASLLGDKIVVQSIRADGAELTFEGSLSGSNLSKIQENVDAYVASLIGPAAKDKKSAPGKKLQVDELVISNAKINLSMTILGGKAVSVPLPDIKLTGLGQGPEGLTPAEVIKVVMKEVMSKTTTAVTGALGNLGKGVTDAAKSVGGAAADAAKGVTKGIGDLFKKKE